MNYARIYKAASDLLLVKAMSFSSESEEYANELVKFEKLVEAIHTAEKLSKKEGSMLIGDIMKYHPLGISCFVYDLYGYNSVVFKITELECQLAMNESEREYQERRKANRAVWDK